MKNRDYYKPKKMNPEVRDKWVAALESGEYSQGRYRLRDELNNFCCLGVLCNLHAQEHPEVASKEAVRRKYMGQETQLPDEVIKWAGLERSYGPLLTIDGKFQDLAIHNDSGVSFEKIAKAIKENL